MWGLSKNSRPLICSSSNSGSQCNYDGSSRDSRLAKTALLFLRKTNLCIILPLSAIHALGCISPSVLLTSFKFFLEQATLIVSHVLIIHSNPAQVRTPSLETPRQLHSTHQFGSLLPSQGDGVMGLIPLPKWSGINLDDGAFHQGLGTHQLVVAGIVHYINDTGLAGAIWNQIDKSRVGTLVFQLLPEATFQSL